MGHRPKRAGRRAPRRHDLGLRILTRFLATVGVTLIAMSAAAQGPPPQPPPSAAGTVGPVVVPTIAPTATTAPDPHATAVPAEPAVADPTAIDIEAINVHSTLQHLGRTAQTTLEVPTGPRYDEAAWYDGSAAPGADGTAVILGHVDSVEDGPSVFYDLGRLRPGDEISVGRADGSVVVFTVDGVRRYPKDEFPSLVVYGDADHPALRLITCGGAFDQSTGHYEDNIVVFASSGDAVSPRDASPRESASTAGG
ncbi:MAG TPA: class F sortase [Euzebya sp.]|nr:class F sortase [Euzebya sp.]